MTIADTLIPYYYWFKSGFGEISIPIGLVNFSLLAITLMTVKGISISMWLIPVVVIAIAVCCTGIGWFNQIYEVNSRMASLVNQKQNPEIKQMSDDIKEIKRILKENV